MNFNRPISLNIVLIYTKILICTGFCIKYIFVHTICIFINNILKSSIITSYSFCVLSSRENYTRVLYINAKMFFSFSFLHRFNLNYSRVIKISKKPVSKLKRRNPANNNFHILLYGGQTEICTHQTSYYLLCIHDGLELEMKHCDDQITNNCNIFGRRTCIL